MPSAKDRPILIGGGSPLVIQQVDGCLHLVDARTLTTAFPDYAVTGIEVNPGSRGARPLMFRNQHCEIRFSFGSLQLAVQTDPEGRNLRIVIRGKKLFGADFVPVTIEDRSAFQSRLSRGSISNLTIVKACVSKAVRLASGHNEIVIHYAGRATPELPRE